jgi:hypothetical protein
MTTETQTDYTTPVISEGHLIDFLHWLSDARDLDVADPYYFDQWLEFVEMASIEKEAAEAVWH